MKHILNLLAILLSFVLILTACSDNSAKIPNSSTNGAENGGAAVGIARASGDDFSQAVENLGAYCYKYPDGVYNDYDCLIMAGNDSDFSMYSVVYYDFKELDDAKEIFSRDHDLITEYVQRLDSDDGIFTDEGGDDYDYCTYYNESIGRYYVYIRVEDTYIFIEGNSAEYKDDIDNILGGIGYVLPTADSTNN